VKRATVITENSTVLEFLCDDYTLVTTEKGVVSHVEFAKSGQIIGIVHGAKFSHMHVEDLPPSTEEASIQDAINRSVEKILPS
jgi:hypothetical protein